MPGSLTPFALLVGFLTVASLASPLHAQDQNADPAADEAAHPAKRKRVADSLSAALQRAVSVEDAYQRLAAAVEKGAEDLNPWSESRALLKSALQRTQEKHEFDALRRSVRQVVSTLCFEPTLECAMPPGFPATTPSMC